jgi:Flp pilus assembly protein TadG
MKRTKLTKQVLADQQGNILPMAAAGILVMAALIGGGVDMSRGYQAQTRLQNACDSAVLAGRRAVTTNGFNAAAEAQAQRYFDVNYSDAVQGTKNADITFDADQSGNAVTATATTTMPMLMMQLFGEVDMPLTANCQSTMGVGNSDVTMVLDVTGSMATAVTGGTRLSALQDAMRNFYDTVNISTAGSNARVRYSFVPFSTTVNVGRLLMDADVDYIANEWTIQSRAPIFNTITEQVRVGWNTPVTTSATTYTSESTSSTQSYTSTKYNTLALCNAALPASTAWGNNGSASTSSGTTINGAGQQVATVTTTQPQIKTTYSCAVSSGKYRRYYYETYRTFYTYQYATSDPILETRTRQEFARWEYRPVRYNTSSLKRFNTITAPTGTNGANINTSWDGCIEERSTVSEPTFTYSSLLGITPADALDLNIDLAADRDEPQTQWGPLWRDVAYTRNSLGTTTSGSKATSYCVPQAQLLREMSEGEVDNYAASLTAQGSTYLDIGLLWGARLSSPDGIFGNVVSEDPDNGGNVGRHIIFMTDGFQEANNSIYQAYGIESLDRRISDDGTTTQTNLRHRARFQAICNAIRGKGIRLWTINFSGSANADLTNCASASSSFNASSAAQLNAAFQEIAKQVGELRVLQ